MHNLLTDVQNIRNMQQIKAESSFMGRPTEMSEIQMECKSITPLCGTYPRDWNKPLQFVRYLNIQTCFKVH